MRAWRRKEKILRETRWAMKPNVFSFLRSLQWWVTFSYFLKLFSYFKNCPNFHKESLRHTQHYTVKRTITVKRDRFQPFRADEDKVTSSQRPITCTLICRSRRGLSDTGWSQFRANQFIPQATAMVWHLAALNGERLSKGELWVHIELTSVVPSSKKQTETKQNKKKQVKEAASITLRPGSGQIRGVCADLRTWVGGNWHQQAGGKRDGELGCWTKLTKS